MVEQVRADPGAAPVSAKLKALLEIAAVNAEIHDTAGSDLRVSARYDRSAEAIVAWRILPCWRCGPPASTAARP